MREALSKPTIFLVGLTAGSVVSFFTLPIWIAPLIDFSQKEAQSNWLSFVGSLLGSTLSAVVAAVAIIFATRSIKEQINVSLYIREEDRIEAQLPPLLQARDAGVSCIIAANDFIRAADQRRSNSYERQSLTDAAERVQRHIEERLTSAMPVLPHEMRSTLEPTLLHLAQSAVALAAAQNQLAIVPSSQSILEAAEYKRQLEIIAVRIYFQTQQMHAAVAAANVQVNSLEHRIKIQQERAQIYKQRIERLLPAGRD
jgi:hypothetical protein